MIDVVNLTTQPVDERFVRKLIENTLRHLRIEGTISMGIAFVGAGAMQKLNKKYRGKDQATDVLSFGAGKNFVAPSGTGKYLGEIVVCNTVIKKHASKAGISFKRELAHVLIHGTLHLLGYEHEGDVNKTEEIHEKEEEIMGLCLKT